MAKISKDGLKIGVTFTPCDKCDLRVNNEHRLEVYDILLKRYGAQLQSVVAIEELSECQKEICKFLRGKGDIDHLAEEVADATIMLEQIKHIYNLDKKVSQYIDEKVQRMVDRLEKTT